MEKIIKAAVDRGASDLHIKAGDVFRARVHGELVPLTKQALTPDQTRSIALHLMQNEDDKAGIDKILDYDCSWSASGIGRFRVNIMRQRGSFSIIMRVIPWEVPTFEQLGLPQVLADIAGTERGMVLVTGVTGSGKSSTMAALINYINSRESRHILTLENPIEFLHRDNKSSITQREVGSDTTDFKMGLRAALRQDPDVIMIGEMRDAETVDTAIKAAETGHLLMSTLHTPDAQSTILRIMAMFAPEEQEIIRIRLAETLHAVISQRLLPKKAGKGRAVAAEIMINTPSIRDLMMDGQRIGEIRDFIAAGREQYGMQTFDQCLADLVRDDVVTFEVAKAAATNPSDFELQMKMFSGGSSGGSRAESNGQQATEPEGEEEPPPQPVEAALDGLQTGGLDFLAQ
jgi:twitching motility protein PilT